LGIEDASGSLNNADSLVGNLDLIDVASLRANDSAQSETEVLGVHVQNEGERQRLSLASGDDGIVSDSAQVADNASRRVGILRKTL
jgi:hypothetical protein